MTELKKALQSKILEFEALRTNPNHQTEMEQNAVLVTLRELKYLDSLAEFEPTETNTLLCDEGLKENQSVPRAVDYIKFMKEVYTPSAPNELLATEAQDIYFWHVRLQRQALGMALDVRCMCGRCKCLCACGLLARWLAPWRGGM